MGIDVLDVIQLVLVLIVCVFRIIISIRTQNEREHHQELSRMNKQAHKLIEYKSYSSND